MDLHVAFKSGEEGAEKMVQSVIDLTHTLEKLQCVALTVTVYVCLGQLDLANRLSSCFRLFFLIILNEFMFILKLASVEDMSHREKE